MEDWARIAQDIGTVYNHYDGFVVLHGKSLHHFIISPYRKIETQNGIKEYFL